MRTIRLIALMLCCAVETHPAAAIVGGGSAAPAAIARSVVTIVGSRGNFCSGALIATDLVLTAAHCVLPGAVYKIVEDGKANPPRLRDVRTVAIHPAFSLQTLLAHRATADVALLQLAGPAPAGKAPVPIGSPRLPVADNSHFTVAGIGVAVRGDGRTGGTIRTAALVATGKPGTLQIRLVDALTQGTRDGLGACTGDSGAPVFEDQDGGAVIIGVVSWSTAANNAAGCGGLTGVTPLTLYRDWIAQTGRAWGSKL